MPFTLPLDEMTVEEKLQAMEAIWASLSQNVDEIESPAWHGEVLRERQRQVDAGETAFIPWEEAKENLRRRAAARAQ
jgi:putative addiction module component (TIGR02574 family)